MTSEFGRGPRPFAAQGPGGPRGGPPLPGIEAKGGPLGGPPLGGGPRDIIICLGDGPLGGGPRIPDGAPRSGGPKKRNLHINNTCMIINSL